MTEAHINSQSASGDAEPDQLAAPQADLAAYTRVYEEHNTRLVAYAVALTGNPSTAEDLVAEAHFRVWRRISGGHAVENVPAYLAATVRNLANTLHRANTEIPLSAEAAEATFGGPRATAAPDDPSQQVAHVDFVTRLLKDLPERWVRALWLAEVEDLPLETVGERIGANSNATAVLLNRAREGLRQAFLRGYPGVPATEACGKHWQRMPSLVRGGLSARQTDSVRMHAEQCDDCRARLAALQQVNLRLPILLGPALLVFTLGGGGLRLLAVAGGGAAGAAGAAAAGAAGAKTGGAVGGARHVRLVRHVGGRLRHGVSSGGKVTAVSAGVVGATAAIAVAAVALTGSGHSGAGARSQGTGSQGTGPGPAKAAAPGGESNSARTIPAAGAAAPTPAAAKPATAVFKPKAAAAEPAAAARPTTPAAASSPEATAKQAPVTPPPTPTSTSTSTSATPPAAPTPDPYIRITASLPPLPQVAVTLRLTPPESDQGQNQDHSSKSPG